MEIQRERYVNPFTDFGFKKIFGEEPNKDILIDFLNELLGDEQHIKDLTYGNLEKHDALAGQRKAVFDLYCENDKGEKFIVEIQKAKQDFFKDRTIFYSTFPIREQAIKGGDWDFELKAVYTIGILDFTFNDEDKDKTVVTEVKLMDTKKNTVFYDKLTYIYLQMPNFTKTEKELKTKFDKWLFVLKNLPKFQNRPQILTEKIFKKLFKIAEVSNFTQQEMMIYEESLKIYRDMRNVIATARRDGVKEGEMKTMIKVAAAMLKKGEPVSKIIEFTGLSREKVEELKNQI